MKSSNFFAFISRMKYITRWGLMRNTIPENIQEHSLQVAMIAHALAVIKNKFFNGNINPERAALYGIFHDSNEIITGDLPTPVKYYNDEIMKAYKKIEDISKERLLSMLPEELKDVYEEIFFYEENEEYRKIVKSADKISAYIKCIEEINTGNSEFREAAVTLKESIDKMGPEVDYFMKTFIPGFSLSLDEL